MAASTHPFADWRAQAPTPRERYERFAVTFQDSVRRFLISGMHIHAGFGDPDSRIRVMTAIRRYLPILHALSASSPFVEGRETGFKSFRLNLMTGLPRTSLPGPLRSRAEFDRLVADYQRMDFIGDASELWWDIRPSSKFPTVEMRICDVCTRIDDAMCIVALYRIPHPLPAPPGHGRPAAAGTADRDHRREPLARPALRRAGLLRR